MKPAADEDSPWRLVSALVMASETNGTNSLCPGGSVVTPGSPMAQIGGKYTLSPAPARRIPEEDAVPLSSHAQH